MDCVGVFVLSGVYVVCGDGCQIGFDDLYGVFRMFVVSDDLWIGVCLMVFCLMCFVVWLGFGCMQVVFYVVIVSNVFVGQVMFGVGEYF